MNDVPFHLTRMGQRFYEHTMPRLVEELAKLNEQFEAVAGALERHEGRAANREPDPREPPAPPGAAP